MGSTLREIPFELDLINDNLALEFVEELSLNFVVNPNFQMAVDRALAAGEFIRDNVIVSIADNDGKTAELFVISLLILLAREMITHFLFYSTDLEINFNEQDRSEIENAAVPLENDVTLSLRPTQIPFTIEITHATITDALDENLFNLTEFLNTDFTDIVHASPGKNSSPNQSNLFFHYYLHNIR